MRKGQNSREKLEELRDVGGEVEQGEGPGSGKIKWRMGWNCWLGEVKQTARWVRGNPQDG